MPEWLSEAGIGETRMALVEGDEILEARILLDGVAPDGCVLAARLIKCGRNGVALSEAGDEYLLPAGTGRFTEGSKVDIVVTRSAIPGTEPWKRPLARLASDQDSLSDASAARAGSLPAAWDDLIDEARSGIVRFAGGELRISPTPAMTLIDVDGALPPDELAKLGAGAAASAIRRLDIGGSIGIDLPTVGSKAARHAAAAAIDQQLSQPFERTAVNGFGFVQVVRPRRRASLVELAQDRARFEARNLLRRAARELPGGKRLVAHPKVIGSIENEPDWLDAIARALGGAIGLRADAALPMSSGYAERA